jgi:cytidylate kinase
MKVVPLRSAQQFVNDKIRLSMLSAAGSSAPKVKPVHWPVITISREPCAGGTTIGRAIAERLGFACWDQELLTRIAAESGAFESILASVDERVSSVASDFVRSLMVGFEYTQSEYRVTLTKVVGAIASQGSAVIVGRGGHFILGPSRCLRVRVTCPTEIRIQRMVERDQVTHSFAQKRVRELGLEVAAFMRHHFQKDVASPEHYDVLVNSGTLSIDQAAELVAAAYRLRFGSLPGALPADAAPLSRVRAVGSGVYTSPSRTGT